MLDTACTRARTKLEQASARRAAVIAEQDRLLALAQGEVDEATVAMAAAIGAETTAHLLGVASPTCGGWSAPDADLSDAAPARRDRMLPVGTPIMTPSRPAAAEMTLSWVFREGALLRLSELSS